MPAFDREQSPHIAKERAEASALAPDSQLVPSVNHNSTVTALSNLLGHDDPSAQDTAATLAQELLHRRQGLLEFSPESGEIPVSDAGTQDQPDDDQPQSLEEPPLPGGGLFGFPFSSERRRTAVPRGSNGVHPRSQRTRAKSSRDERTLFDYVPIDQAIGELQPPAPEETPSPTVATIPAKSESFNPPDLFAYGPESSSPHAPFTIASGEKAKARDILAAIRALKTIEQEQRVATPEERQTLARFAGFGPVALSIFPDPVTGHYKDMTWQAVGEELKSLLTPEEYHSAKRTTFNAFYTSPTVIAAMHEALCRLGVPRNATILEPGCGTGNFMSLGQQGLRFIGVELDRISGRIAKALHPEQDIRIENFRDTRLSEGSVDAVIGNVPFADLKLDYRGLRLSLHDFFFAKSIDALKPGGVLTLVTTHFTLDKVNGAIREYLAAKADFVGAIRLPSDAFKREGTAVVTDIVFLRKRSLEEPPQHADRDWLSVVPLTIEDVEIPINCYFVTHPEMVLGAWTRKDTLYGGEGYSVTANGDLAEQLAAAIRGLPEYAPLQAVPVQEHRAPTFTPYLSTRMVGVC